MSKSFHECACLPMRFNHMESVLHSPTPCSKPYTLLHSIQRTVHVVNVNDDDGYDGGPSVQVLSVSLSAVAIDRFPCFWLQHNTISLVFCILSK